MPSIIAAGILPASVSTFRPVGRYRAALFIEKEGFRPILERAQIAERFDIALMSTKGMSVTASRQLIDGLAAMGVRVFVLRDFDITGFSIQKTFTGDGRRHTFKNKLAFRPMARPGTRSSFSPPMRTARWAPLVNASNSMR